MLDNLIGIGFSVEHDTGDNGIDIEMKNRVHEAIRGLPDRQREVICRMYGIEYNDALMEPMTQAQVADLIGITRQRICAIVKGAQEHIKKELERFYET